MSHAPDSTHEELFVIPYLDDQYYLYAPLRRLVFSLNHDAVRVVSKYCSNHNSTFSSEESQIIDQLRTSGLFSEPPPEPPIRPENYLFRPHEVTLFPTTRCNLKCIYCYANAGSRHIDMPWEIAKAGIDYVIENARAVGRDDFIVGFHGGGEPTVNWRLIKRATLYARRQAKEHGFDVKIHCATNGVLSPAKRDFIVENFTGINISIDGPQEIQDRQRPLLNGRGSFGKVLESIRFFQQTNFPFGIRVTLTAFESHSLQKIVRFFHDECPHLDQLHVEPVWQCGRCQTTGERPPDDDQFISDFVEAYELAAELGFKLFYSGARLDVLTNRFCAAAGDGFSVTPEGIVSSCFEVSDPADPRSELYHYGQYDKTSKQFIIDRSKVDRLRNLCVENLPHCQDCFCKWHCAGDCLAKALRGMTPADHSGSSRCQLNRVITLKQLDRMVKESIRIADTEAG